MISGEAGIAAVLSGLDSIFKKQQKTTKETAKKVRATTLRSHVPRGSLELAVQIFLKAID